MKKVIIGTAAFVMLVGCQKEPKACFTIDKTTAQVGETVTFKDCSENTTRKTLKTGELASGIPIAIDFEGTAEYVYHTAGTYTVELDALNCTKDNKCKSNSTSKTITITQ